MKKLALASTTKVEAWLDAQLTHTRYTRNAQYMPHIGTPSRKSPIAITITIDDRSPALRLSATYPTSESLPLKIESGVWRHNQSPVGQATCLRRPNSKLPTAQAEPQAPPASTMSRNLDQKKQLALPLPIFGPGHFLPVTNLSSLGDSGGSKRMMQSWTRLDPCSPLRIRSDLQMLASGNHNRSEPRRTWNMSVVLFIIIITTATTCCETCPHASLPHV
ncbi:hypothetical protein L210DRAFT_3071189 [Boletus edulis BED1]|uniref:Uncharacterized protein n=1 Tax=Boletus edulis BED1 TaxID=1328754 RepID=A0AAD4BHY3_BOLED|nr:hypothetical protein L210DRAFT_3071189 [Boletus edulis BED1]